MKDESTLLQKCQYFSTRKDADKRLKGIVDMVHKGEIQIRKVENLNNLLREFEAEKSEIFAQNEALKRENQRLKEEVESQVWSSR